MLEKRKTNRQLKPVTILLTAATYAEHKGSAAILVGTIQSLRKVFPYVHFLFYSSNPTDNDILKLRSPDVDVIPYSFKNRLFEKNRVFEFMLGAIFYRLSKKHYMDIFTALRDTDIILDLSGDGFASEYGLKSMLPISFEILFARLTKKPIVLYCQSIGPFKGIVHRSIGRFSLKLANVTIAREEITSNYLKSLGVDNYVCSDPAFLLEFTRQVEMELPKKTIIGLNLSAYIDTKYGGESPSNRYRFIMSQFIDNLIERYDAHILIIPEVVLQKPSSQDDDYTVSKKIFNKLIHPEHVTIIEGDLSPAELKSIVGLCDILVSPRFHLVILALSQYVPSIAIAYIPKSIGIMKMIGLSEYVVNYQDISLDLLMTKVQSLCANKKDIQEHLNKKMPEITAKALNATNIVRAQLNE